MAARTLCPHPEKHGYDQLGAISVALRLSRRRGVALRVYHCSCGVWHLTKQLPMWSSRRG